MMRRMIVSSAGAGVVSLLLVATVAAAGHGPAWGAGSRPTGEAAPCQTAVASPLTTPQAAALQAMAEEEKLAGDLYRAFAARYPSRVWDNIAASEARHLDAVRRLMTRYGIADPTLGRTAGSFASPEIQAMYTSLLATGLQSQSAAFGVGRTVELDDIAELKSSLAGITAGDVTRVYTSLLKGSERHLAAFTRLIAR